MRIRMLTSLGGVDKDGRTFVYNVDEEHDLPNKDAKEYLERGQAEPVATKAHDRAEKRVVAAETR